MNSFATLLAVFAGVTAVAVNNPQPLEARQGNFAIQNWGNDWAEYNFTSGSAGKYTVDWNNPPGGNFVVGKGYRGQDM
jgi:endo-1,4-beta-xylanase